MNCKFAIAVVVFVAFTATPVHAQTSLATEWQARLGPVKKLQKKIQDKEVATLLKFLEKAPLKAPAEIAKREGEPDRLHPFAVVIGPGRGVTWEEFNSQEALAGAYLPELNLFLVREATDLSESSVALQMLFETRRAFEIHKDPREEVEDPSAFYQAEVGRHCFLHRLLEAVGGKPYATLLQKKMASGLALDSQLLHSRQLDTVLGPPKSAAELHMRNVWFWTHIEFKRAEQGKDALTAKAEIIRSLDSL